MANSYSAVLTIDATADEYLDATAGDGASGALTCSVVNNTRGRRWSNGGASGQIEKVYKAVLSFTSGETKSYDILAAGSLTTPDGVAIDADEIKFMVVKCSSGQFKLVANATNGLDCFTAASEGINLNATAGVACVALDFGAAGMDVTTNSKFNLVETGSSTATGEIIFGVAE